MENEYETSQARRPFKEELEDLIQQMLDADEARYEQKDLVSSILMLAPSTSTDLAVVRAAIAELPQATSALVKYTAPATGVGRTQEHVLTAAHGVAVGRSQQHGLSFAQQAGIDIHEGYRPTIRATARIASPEVLPSSTAAGAISSFGDYTVLAAPQEIIGALPRTATAALPSKQRMALASGVPQYAALLPAVSTHIEESPLEVAVAEPKRRRTFKAFETFNEQKPAHPSFRRFAVQAMKLAAGIVFTAASMSSKPYEAPVKHEPITVAPVVVSAPSYHEQLVRAIDEGVFDLHVVRRDPALTSTFGKRDLYEWREVKRTAKGRTTIKRIKIDIPGSKNHLGIDVRSYVSDRNLALADGRVTHIDRGPGMSGAYIRVATIDSTQGKYDTLFVTTYRHGSIPRTIKEGMNVHKGDVLSIVAPRTYSGVKPHTHVEVTAVGGLYEKMRGQRLNTFCLYTPAIREQIIQNMEKVAPGDLPSGFRYMEGETVREKLELACERQAYKLAYGQQLPPIIRLANGKEYYSLTTEEIKPAVLAPMQTVATVAVNYGTK